METLENHKVLALFPLAKPNLFSMRYRFKVVLPYYSQLPKLLPQEIFERRIEIIELFTADKLPVLCPYTVFMLLNIASFAIYFVTFLLIAIISPWEFRYHYEWQIIFILVPFLWVPIIACLVYLTRRRVIRKFMAFGDILNRFLEHFNEDDRSTYSIAWHVTRDPSNTINLYFCRVSGWVLEIHDLRTKNDQEILHSHCVDSLFTESTPPYDHTKTIDIITRK
ncbi:uncharacterized protein VTP21DRAFT_8824 [Calcarisporiella thermophila]|uniref:uncharacterized protein n=1 Tax=Calcarisporiella thermophila TaxID=911321 RepID=UPI003743558C